MSLTNDLVHDPLTNAPPEGINAILARERADELVKGADVWASVDKITSADQANKAKDALDQFDAELKKIDAWRREDKKLFDDGAKAVQAAYLPSMSKITTAKAPIKQLHDDWLRREDERLDRERREAEAKAAELRRLADVAAQNAAQERITPVSAQTFAMEAVERARAAEEAAAAIPDRARVSGSYGHPARSLREVWFGTVIDVVKAARYYRKNHVLLEALTKLVNADARAGVRAVPGCEIKSRKE